MKTLKNYAKRNFLITGNVRDEFILPDTFCIQLDHYLFYYLKDQLKYDSVVFLDARGLYYFDNESKSVLNKKCSSKISKKEGLGKLKKPAKKITMKKNNNTNQVNNDLRLRITYEGDILEITQFFLSHIRSNKVKFAFIVYDGSLFEKLSTGSDVWVQMQGMLRNEIYNLPTENKNIFVWVDGEEYNSLSERFARLGLDFLFNIIRDQSSPVGKAVIIDVPTAGKDEIQRSVSLHSLKKKNFPPFDELKQYAPVLAGEIKLKQDTLKTFKQYLNEEENFWKYIKNHYKLNFEKQTAIEQLNEMIGLNSVKKEITNIVNGIEKKEKKFKDDFKLTPERFKIIESNSLPFIPHLALLGNPGTGKTTIARLIGKILREEGLLESGHLVEITSENLTADHVGGTAIKTKEQIKKAIGGILFIDEAYQLITDNRSNFGKEALAELVRAMSYYEGQFMVIFAGYQHETEAMLKHNPGCARRIKHIILPDYSDKELQQIMILYLNKNSLTVEQEIFDTLGVFCKNLLLNREKFGGNHFGNADVVVKQIRNANQTARAQNSNILKAEHFEFSNFFKKTVKHSDDLDELIGLEEIKIQLKVLLKRAKIEKMDPGHYLFQGNPGTGKTVVASQIAKKFYEMKLLKSAKLNRYTASELSGEHLGDTENKLRKILEESLGGVLFIDEAHQLASKHSYGQNVLQTILPFMEDRRSEFTLIFAGYPDKIQDLFKYDPGLKGRFKQFFTFKDYSSIELLQIFHKMFKEESAYKLETIQDALLIDIFKEIKYKEKDSFSNARMVRNFIDKLKDKAIQNVKSGYINQNQKVFICDTDVIQVGKEWE